MKKMSKRSIIDCRQVSHVLDEKALLFAARCVASERVGAALLDVRHRHPFVVEAVDTYNDDNYLYLFLEVRAQARFAALMSLAVRAWRRVVHAVATWRH